MRQYDGQWVAMGVILWHNVNKKVNILTDVWSLFCDVWSLSKYFKEIMIKHLILLKVTGKMKIVAKH